MIIYKQKMSEDRKLVYNGCKYKSVLISTPCADLDNDDNHKMVN